MNYGARLLKSNKHFLDTYFLFGLVLTRPSEIQAVILKEILGHLYRISRVGCDSNFDLFAEIKYFEMKRLPSPVLKKK
jgi:hypothetical protein